MGGKKGGKGGVAAEAAVEGGGGSKKAQGQARKAEAANKKAAAENAKLAAVEDADWDKGAKKGNAKKEAADAKAAEVARKKAERDALMAEEDKGLPSRAGPKNAKTAVKKTRGLDLSQLDEAFPTLNASGIDNANDVFEVLDTKPSAKVQRGQGNKNAAWEAFKDQRIDQLREEGYFKIKGNKLSKVTDDLWEEFEASELNPKNQFHVAYNATKAEIAEATAARKAEIEARLAGP